MTQCTTQEVANTMTVVHLKRHVQEDLSPRYYSPLVYNLLKDLKRVFFFFLVVTVNTKSCNNPMDEYHVGGWWVQL